MSWFHQKRPSAKSAKNLSIEDKLGQAPLRSVLVKHLDYPSYVVQKFNVLDVIGQGSYGRVEKVVDKFDSSFKVVKTVSKPDSWGEDRLKMEAILMHHLDHPHILRIFSWAYGRSVLKILMEYCEGGELVRCVKEGRSSGEILPDKWTATALGQCFQALVYIHGKGFIHKDIKGSNILLLRNTTCSKSKPFGKRPHCVIGDLGSAEVMPRGYFSCRGTRVAGTPSTMAPEVWNGSCGPKSDVWSMGCVLYEILTGLLPFSIDCSFDEALERKSTWLDAFQTGPRWDFRSMIESKSFCQQLLTFKESSRPSAIECLRHPWLFEVRPSLTASDKKWLLKAVTDWEKSSTPVKAFCLKLAAEYCSIGRYAQVFSALDFDCSGVLEKQEILNAVTSLGLDKAAAKGVASSLDIDGNNCCQYLEFAAMCLPTIGPELDKQIIHVFKDLDLNSNGRLEFSELLPLLEELQLLVPSLAVKPNDLDRNKDGFIDFSEFCEFFGPPALKMNQLTDLYFSEAAQSNSTREPLSQADDASSFNGSFLCQTMETSDTSSACSRDPDRLSVHSIKAGGLLRSSRTVDSSNVLLAGRGTDEEKRVPSLKLLSPSSAKRTPRMASSSPSKEPCRNQLNDDFGFDNISESRTGRKIRTSEKLRHSLQGEAWQSSIV